MLLLFVVDVTAVAGGLWIVAVGCGFEGCVKENSGTERETTIDTLSSSMGQTKFDIF